MNFKDDWRDTGQEDYLMGVKLFFKKYSTYSETWDHDHCDFCKAKLSVLMPDCETEGFATEDNYRWICKRCFEDFKDHFKWEVIFQK